MNGKYQILLCIYLFLITVFPNLRYLVGKDSHYLIESLAKIICIYLSGILFLFNANLMLYINNPPKN